MLNNSRNNFLIISLVAMIFFVFGVGIGQNVQLIRPSVAPESTADLSNPLCPAGLPEFVDPTQVDFNLFWDVWASLEDRYYKRSDIKDQELFYGAIRGMVASLHDPYTVYFEPKAAEEFNKELEGKFEGIGAEIGIKQDRLTIIAPLPGSPAEQAGLLPGDKILSIDAFDTTNIFVDEAVDRIRGTKGTTVTLTIFRKGDSATMEKSIRRDEIVVNTISWKFVGSKKDLAYLRVYSFDQDTANDFRDAVTKILRQSPKGLIVDLRANPGGFLDVAVKMASFWIAPQATAGPGLKPGVIVQERFSDGRVQYYQAEGRPKFDKIKTIVLVNEGSASASEILAGALQDYGLGVTVGEKTFGKGSVQDYSPLPDGSALKITVAEWLTPKGISINEAGINPQVEVKMISDDVNQDRDPQLDKAIQLLE